jgi:opine dehydrogenase
VYGPLPAPTSLVHRYLTEDVPCGAVPVTDLARQLGVPAPVTAAGVTVADALLGTSWARTGRTMARLGLEGASAGEIHRRLLG